MKTITRTISVLSQHIRTISARLATKTPFSLAGPFAHLPSPHFAGMSNPGRTHPHPDKALPRGVLLFSHNDNSSGESEGSGNKTVNLSTEYVGSVYMFMFPEDKTLTGMSGERVTHVAKFIFEMDGRVPMFIPNSLRAYLQTYGHTSKELDNMSPLQANALKYRHENGLN